MRRLACALALILPACASTTSRPLAGSEWQIVRINGETIDTSQAFARFDGNGMTVSFGCNTGRGPFRQQGNMLITNGGVARTEMACVTEGTGPDLMAIEDRGFAILSRPMRIAAENGRMTLSNEVGTIELAA